MLSIHNIVKADRIKGLDLQSGTLYEMKTNYPIVDAVGLLPDGSTKIGWYLFKFHYKHMKNIAVNVTCFARLSRVHNCKAICQFLPTSKTFTLTVMLYYCMFHHGKFQQAEQLYWKS